MVGGELKAYTELLQEARNEALQRMMMDAQARGANAIVMFDLQHPQFRAVQLNCLLMDLQ